MPLSPEEKDSLRPPWGTRAVIVHTGNLLEVIYVGHDRRKRSSKRRGGVGEFSRSARLRMLRMCSTINWDAAMPGVFVTLTYPDDRVATDSRVRTQERDAFFRATEKYLGREIPVLWRTEWKPRLSGKWMGHAAPHVHLLILSCSFVSYSTVNRVWCGVIGADGYCRTDVRKIRTAEHAARYVSKYAAKLPEDLSLVNTSKISVEGRHWGIHRRNLVPWYPQNILCDAPKWAVRLAENGASTVFRYFTRDVDQGFCLFGDVARKLGQHIFDQAIARGRES